MLAAIEYARVWNDPEEDRRAAWPCHACRRTSCPRNAVRRHDGSQTFVRWTEPAKALQAHPNPSTRASDILYVC